VTDHPISLNIGINSLLAWMSFCILNHGPWISGLWSIHVVWWAGAATITIFNSQYCEVYLTHASSAPWGEVSDNRSLWMYYVGNTSPSSTRRQQILELILWICWRTGTAIDKTVPVWHDGVVTMVSFTVSHLNWINTCVRFLTLGFTTFVRTAELSIWFVRAFLVPVTVSGQFPPGQ
jgi:hypothetical protein